MNKNYESLYNALISIAEEVEDTLTEELNKTKKPEEETEQAYQLGLLTALCGVCGALECRGPVRKVKLFSDYKTALENYQESLDECDEEDAEEATDRIANLLKKEFGGLCSDKDALKAVIKALECCLKEKNSDAGKQDKN